MGCFCDACIAAFNSTYHRTETRQSLGLAIERCIRGPRSKTIDEWTDYICEKTTRLAKALALPGINLGIMVMHRGDDRHGIRVADWRPFVRHLRLGEAHFNDRDFGPPRGKASEIAGMQLHIAGMATAELYSETTAFPAHSLSKANLVCKARLAVALGIPNLFIMGGTFLITQNYWEEFAKALPGLREVESLAGDLSHPRVAPVHVAVGQGDFELPWWPLRVGIPARPVLASDTGDDGGVLLVLGTTRLGPEWSGRLRRYKRVLFDSTAAGANKPLLRENPTFRMLERAPPAIARLIAKASPDRRELALATRLRQELRDVDPSVPCLERGTDIFLAWVKDKGIAVACNLRAEPNEGTLKLGQQTIDLKLDGLEMVVIKLGDGGASIVARV